MDYYIKILWDNENAENDSLIYYLHEESKFNYESFSEYCNAIKAIGLYRKDNYLDREITRIITRTYSFIIKCFLYHHNPNDLYKIENIEEYKINDYLEELDMAIGIYYRGE